MPCPVLRNASKCHGVADLPLANGCHGVHLGAPHVPALVKPGHTCYRIPSLTQGMAMKENIHPHYQPSSITCACGSVVETFSTRGSFAVEICSACHPFFT